MKKFLSMVLAGVLSVSLAACGSKEQPAAPAPAEEENEAFTCIVSESPEGAPFSKLTWQGFESIEKTGTKVQFVEALEPSEFEEQLRAMADLGANPIYSMFDGVNLVAIDIADEYPDTQFILIDCNQEVDKANVTNIVVDSFEPSFVAGLVAALTTKTGSIGWVGGLDIPVISRFADGYKAGVAYANEVYGLDVKVQTTFIGDDADTVKAAESAKMLMNQNCDVIYHSANEAGLGVIQACADKGVLCIGVDKWQGDVNDVVFWSALIAIDSAVTDAYEKFTSGALEQESLINYGIANDLPVYDARDYEKLPDNVKEAVDILISGIKDGSVDVFSYMQ